MSISFFSRSTYTTEDISYINPMVGNYSFDTSLTDFGLMKERKIRKVNRYKSLLKLTQYEDTTSIYPMIDEFGYTFADFFIFKSSWDLEYHIEITEN